MAKKLAPGDKVLVIGGAFKGGRGVITARPDMTIGRYRVTLFPDGREIEVGDRHLTREA